MSAYEVSGSIILKDAFSTALDALESGVRDSQEMVQALGQSLDNLGGGANVEAVLGQIDRLGAEAQQAGRAMQQMGQGLQTTVAKERVQQLEHAIAAMQLKARQGVHLTVGDIGQLQAMNAELAQLKSGLAEAAGGAKKTSGAFTALIAGFGAFGIAMGAQQIVGGIAAMTTLGAKAEATEDIFKRLTAEQGVNADKLLSDMQRATHGTVSALELMTQANRMALSQGQEGLAALPALAAGARSAALAQGESVSFMLNSVVEGIRKASPELLDNLGLTLRVGEANQVLADSLGKSVDALTAQERATALRNAALEALDEFTRRVGASAQTSADNIQTMATAAGDLKIAVAGLSEEAGVPDWIGALAKWIMGQTDVLKGFDRFRDMQETFKAAGMDEEAAQAQKAAEAVRRMGAEAANSLPWVQELFLSLQVLQGGEVVKLDAVGASIGNLIGAIDPAPIKAFPPALMSTAQAADITAQSFDLLGISLRGVVASANGLASIPTLTAGMERAIGGVEAKLLSLAGTMDRATLMAWRGKALNDLQTMFDGMGDVTEFGMNLMTAEYLGGWDNVVTGVRDRQRDLERGQEAHMNKLFDSASSLRSSIEAVLNADPTPTQADFDATAAGTYENKVKESANRLQAIAERGFAELQVHPDWAAALKIPEDVLTGSEAQLKAWAGKTAQDVKDNVRPDLIDWDRFVADFKANMEREAAKGLTLDEGAMRLKAAGVLDVDSKAMRDKMAEQLGLKAPELTIDAMFETDPDAGAQLVSKITGGLPALPVPITPVMPAGQAAAEGGGTTPALPTGDAGAAGGTALAEGFQGAAVGVDVGTIILAAWTTSLTAQMAGFYNVGEQVGGQVAAGVLDATKRDLVGFRSTLIAILLPPLETALRRSLGGKREME